MTVSSQISRKDYAGNGSTTAFATEFRFLEDTHLKVISTVDATSVETEQVLTTNYTVTGTGDDSGGTVTMLIAPATGETLTIKRDVPFTQQTDYVENDEFPAESHERALDKLTMVVQQQQEELDRSIKLSEGQQSSGLTIPAPDTGKFLQWDALGNFINVDIANQGLLAVTPFGETLVAAADAAAGRVIMESAKKVSSAVTDNITTFDADDEAKDSGINIARVVQIADAAGAADVITAAFTPAITALTDGLGVRVRALLANATTTPTINFNGLGAKTIVKAGNQPLSAGDIANPDHELILVYNLDNDNVELLNPAIIAVSERLLATAWINFNGADAPTIRDSENISSITDRAVGRFTINFATPMANDDYCAVYGGPSTSSGSSVVFGYDFDTQLKTVSSLNVNAERAGSPKDDPDLSIVIFGGTA